jgi:hypothetical protein
MNINVFGFGSTSQIRSGVTSSKDACESAADVISFSSQLVCQKLKENFTKSAVIWQKTYFSLLPQELLRKIFNYVPIGNDKNGSQWRLIKVNNWKIVNDIYCDTVIRDTCEAWRKLGFNLNGYDVPKLPSTFRPEPGDVLFFVPSLKLNELSSLFQTSIEKMKTDFGDKTSTPSWIVITHKARNFAKGVSGEIYEEQVKSMKKMGISYSPPTINQAVAIFLLWNQRFPDVSLLGKRMFTNCSNTVGINHVKVGSGPASGKPILSLNESGRDRSITLLPVLNLCKGMQ